MARIEYEDDDTLICIELQEGEDGLILHNRDDLDMKFREMLTALGFRYPQDAYDTEPEIEYTLGDNTKGKITNECKWGDYVSGLFLGDEE